MRKNHHHKIMIYKEKIMDLKSPARKGVPVRFRLRAPSFNKGLRAKATQAFVRFRFAVLAIAASMTERSSKSGTTKPSPMPK